MSKRCTARGLPGFALPRPDASNPTAILDEMRTAFEEFKTERTKEVEDLKKGLGD